MCPAVELPDSSSVRLSWGYSFCHRPFTHFCDTSADWITFRMPCTLSCSLGLLMTQTPAAEVIAQVLMSAMRLEGLVLRTVAELPLAIVSAVSVEPGAVTRPLTISSACPICWWSSLLHAELVLTECVPIAETRAMFCGLPVGP